VISAIPIAFYYCRVYLNLY